MYELPYYSTVPYWNRLAVGQTMRHFRTSAADSLVHPYAVDANVRIPTVIFPSHSGSGPCLSYLTGYMYSSSTVLLVGTVDQQLMRDGLGATRVRVLVPVLRVLDY